MLGEQQGTLAGFSLLPVSLGLFGYREPFADFFLFLELVVLIGSGFRHPARREKKFQQIIAESTRLHVLKTI